jgi:hypothetical protein
MQAAGADAGGGSGEIHPLGFEALIECGVFEGGFARVDFRFEVLFDGVEEFALRASLIGREFSQLLAEFGELAFSAESFDANSFYGFNCRSVVELLQSVRVKGV